MLTYRSQYVVKLVSDALTEAAKRSVISKTAPPVRAVSDGYDERCPIAKRSHTNPQTPSSTRGIRTIDSINEDVYFGSIKVLEGWPNSDKARDILERLAQDPGITGVMKKHNWRVGLLCEMSPLEVTKLGHNVNKGLEISLRLRFNEGFRSYNSVKGNPYWCFVVLI